MCFDFLYSFSQKYFYYKKRGRINKNIRKFSCQRFLSFVKFTRNMNFPDRYSDIVLLFKELEILIQPEGSKPIWK